MRQGSNVLSLKERILYSFHASSTNDRAWSARNLTALLINETWPTHDSKRLHCENNSRPGRCEWSVGVAQRQWIIGQLGVSSTNCHSEKVCPQSDSTIFSLSLPRNFFPGKKRENKTAWMENAQSRVQFVLLSWAEKTKTNMTHLKNLTLVGVRFNAVIPEIKK